MRGHQLNRQRMVVERLQQGFDLMALITRPVELDIFKIQHRGQQMQAVRPGQTCEAKFFNAGQTGFHGTARDQNFAERRALGQFAVQLQQAVAGVVAKFGWGVLMGASRRDAPTVS